MTSNLKDNLLKTNISKMKFKGLLAGSVSLNGHSPDLLKRGMQYYGHLGELEKCEWCVVELDLFSECAGEPIRTNTINRLIVSCCKEIGLMEPTLPIIMGRLVREWDTHRNSEAGGPRLDRISLLKMIRLLTSSHKIQLPNEIRAVYNQSLSYTQITTDPRFKEIYDHMDELPDAVAGSWDMFSDKDTDELLPLMDGLVYQLDMRDDRVFYYMFRILKLGEEKKRCSQRFRGWQPSSYPLTKSFGGRFQPVYAIWQHLFIRAAEEGIQSLVDSLEVLFEWYNNRSDNWVYLTQAILYFIKDCNWDHLIEEPPLTSETASIIYNNNYTSPLILDCKLYDKNGRRALYNGDNGNNGDNGDNGNNGKIAHLVNHTYSTITTILNDIIDSQPITKQSTRKTSKSSKLAKETAVDLVVIELEEDPIPG